MVRDYATKKQLNKPLWCCFPQLLQRCIWWTRNDKLNYIPLKAYAIFCPPLHILDIVFLLLSISGVVLEFTVLRSATATDEVCNTLSLLYSIIINTITI